jgi:hypothetical protein
MTLRRHARHLCLRGGLRTGIVVLALAASGLAPAPVSIASQERALPEADSFYASVRENLARADREQYRYAYRERRSDVHTNPFGRLGTDGTLLYEVTPGDEVGIFYRRLLERDGKPHTDEKPEKVDRRERGKKPNPSIEDVVGTLDFQIRRRETVGGRDMIVVEFQPRKDARPKTRQGRIAKVFKGTAWIDEAAREVARVEATSIDDISYGFGIVARLGDGTKATLVRERIDSHVWMPTSVQLIGQGRALLLRRLKIDFAVEWFDYRRTLG